MFRLAAALIFTIAGGLAGAMKAEKLRASCRRCDSIAALIRRLTFLVGTRGDDVYSVCRQIKSDPEFADLHFVHQLPESFAPESDFRECWRTAVESQPDCDRDESEILLQIGSILGKSDSNSQISGLAEVRRELAGLAEIRSAELAKKGRLYRSAGILMGAMAGIMLM